MAAVKIKENLYWVGVQDHDLRVFDVVMETEYGTSYNSYLLKTPEYNVLFETAKLKFFDKFLENLEEVCDPSELDYIVVDHTEPDHAGSLEKLLDYAPKAKVLASPIALGFLKDICNREIPGIAVSDNQVIKLDTCSLKFLSVPFLHWPDSIYTYIEEMKTLVTCDSFGCHYADDRVCNDLIEGDFVKAYRYYFEMIMGPFKSYVQYALGRIKEFDIETICPGHGPVLRERLDYYLGLYDEWSQVPPKEKRDKPKVVTAFVSAYGYSEQLAHEIAEGIHESVDAEVQLYDMVYADAAKVQKELEAADGILLGSPTINGDALPPVLNLIMNMNGVLHGGKVAGAFGSYGWSGEAADMLMGRLNVLRMNTIEPPLKITFKPGDNDIKAARKYGRKFGKKLKEEFIKMNDSSSGKTYWKCTVCGEVFEGALPPISCPVCGAGQEAFVEYVQEVINFSDDREFKAVIIGSGAGAVSAAEALRKRNSKASIDIYTREKVLPYYRPVLTKGIAEKLHDSEYYIQAPNFYTMENINVHLDSEVAEINPDRKNLKLQDGKTVDYDKLLIATGASNFIPPFAGADLPGVVALREQTDFDHLAELIAGGSKRVVVIGGGLLGLETACSLTGMGHSVSVLEACPTILPRQLDDDGARMFKKIMTDCNCSDVRLGVFVDEICGHDKVSGVKLKDGSVIDCDVAIISAGVRSNIKLAKQAGLKIDRAIVVDSKMQTSHSDIYAVGDCAIYNGRFDGIWETAIDQGKIAGANMAGDHKDYEPKVFGATLRAFGTRLFSIGDLGRNDTNGEYQQVSKSDELNNTYRKLYFKNGRLTGGILLGDVSLTNALLVGVTKAFDAEEAADYKLL
jgi:flavorubredoxin/NADPH-dependent 2,4-dienoyl-CoA reductase/sulfur reductase-like enzyme